MRTYIFMLLIVLGSVYTLQAQENSSRKHAIGLRFANNDGIGTEVNYQLRIGGNNRLEFGAGWRSADDTNQLKTVGLIQWVFPLDGNFHWYAGGGGGIGHISFDSDYPGDPDDETYIYLAGNAGIEYDFNAPIMLFFDVRPEFGLGSSIFFDDFEFEFGFGIRYQFD